MAILVAHAELAVKGGDLAVQQLFHRFLELGVSLVDAAQHFGEAQVVALHRHAEDIEHGARPEDDALAHIPVPHAALAAVQRLVEPRGGKAEDRIRFSRLRRLPVEGGAEHDQHQQRHDEQKRDLRDAGAPGRQHICLALEHDQASGKVAQFIKRYEGCLA